MVAPREYWYKVYWLDGGESENTGFLSSLVHQSHDAFESSTVGPCGTCHCCTSRDRGQTSHQLQGGQRICSGVPIASAGYSVLPRCCLEDYPSYSPGDNHCHGHDADHYSNH